MFKNILKKNKKVVVIGGGTGLSILLRGLKNYTENITAIVAVTDDGGGSGFLREDLGMLPPGDIRNCILALAETENIMQELLNYRFDKGNLKGQSFGNLFLAAMNGISSDFNEGIKNASKVLAVKGKVIPVSLDDIILYGKLENGIVVKGESQIPKKSIELKSPIKNVFIKPKYSKPVDEAIRAIEESDLVILGPGSLYTSIIPNLLIDDLRKSLSKLKKNIVYIPNIMTQPGETDNYGIYEHLKAIIDHAPGVNIFKVYVNNGVLSKEVLSKYEKEDSIPILLSKEDRINLKKLNVRIVEDDFVEVKYNYIRHNSSKLCKKILEGI